MTKRMLFVLLLLLIVIWPATVLAQGASPAPVTTLGVVVMVIGLLLGFINQGISQGSILGSTVKVPPTWLPYLTLAATFLSGGVASLTTSDAVTAAAVLLAVYAGFQALISTGGGIALAHHMGQPKRTAKMKAATAAATLSCMAIGCAPAISPAQQVQDGTAFEGCVAANYGQSVEAIAATCLNSELPAAIDVISDVEALVEVFAGSPNTKSPYAGDARVMTLVPAKITALRSRVAAEKK